MNKAWFGVLLPLVAYAALLLASGCNVSRHVEGHKIDFDKKPTRIPSVVHKYTLKVSGTRGVTLSGFYEAYQPDGAESGDLWEVQSLPLTLEIKAACVRGIMIRGGDPGTLELEILRDEDVVLHKTCSLVPGALEFRYPEDQG